MKSDARRGSEVQIEESEEARRERDACPVCRSPQRHSVERMRRMERLAYADIHRYLLVMGEDASLRWVIRHFLRGHDLLSPAGDADLPTWLFDDEEEFERYMHQYGYCRTIDDLCPHIPPRTVSSCEEIGHPECGPWRAYALRERVADLEAHRTAPPPPAAEATGPLSLVEPLAVNQVLEVEVEKGARPGIYGSAVVAIDASQLVISLPTRLKETLALAPGDRIGVYYQGRVSKYAFETAVRAVQGSRVILEPPVTVGIASRRSPRISLRDSMARVVRMEAGGAEVAGTGIDASARGMRLVLPEELSQWERVRITLQLPDGPLAVDGEVVRVEREAAGRVVHGIYFMGLTPQDIARLRQLRG